MIAKVFDKSGSFISVDAPHRLTQTYSDNPSAEFLNKKQVELALLAEELQINMVMVRTENGFEFGFENIVDKTTFHRQAFNPINEPESNIWTEQFSPDTPYEYIAAWAQSVAETAEAQGIPYKVEIQGNDVVVKLDSIENFSGFLQARDDGFFDQLADEKLLSGRKPEGWTLH